MLLYLIIGVVIFTLFYNYNEGFTEYKKEKIKVLNPSCDSRHKAISEYPRGEEQIDLLFNAKFKPECCPTPYSNSSGCLCNDLNHSELIIMRGGNRIMC